MSTIQCRICGDSTHSIQLHLSKAHPGTTLQNYQERFPDAPVFSALALEAIERKRQAEAAQAEVSDTVTLAHAATAATTAAPPAARVFKRPAHEVFNLPLNDFKSGRGGAIDITCFAAPPERADDVPAVDPGHVWNADDLKNAMMAVELNIPLYVWGHKGTGKTTDLEQIAACTGRPMMRVQHTINTEESHIIGQWMVRDGQTVFELGPLAVAMKYGYTYLADEYDFALASVLSVYQPVLEGKSLLIKEADAANRIIRPHPNFRFWATGNTNGSGDDTGLYQGTSVQNAANYDRFGMVIQKQYMPAPQEAKIICNRSGISEAESKKLVDFAGKVRTEFGAGKLSDTISTRALVYIAQIGLRKGSMKPAIELCFANKLAKVDRETIKALAQRIYTA